MKVHTFFKTYTHPIGILTERRHWHASENSCNHI